MSWRDERDDERAVERWRGRMLERYHRDQTLQVIEAQRGLLRRELRTGVIVAAVMFAAAFAWMRC